MLLLDDALDLGSTDVMLGPELGDIDHGTIRLFLTQLEGKDLIVPVEFDGGPVRGSAPPSRLAYARNLWNR